MVKINSHNVLVGWGQLINSFHKWFFKSLSIDLAYTAIPWRWKHYPELRVSPSHLVRYILFPCSLLLSLHVLGLLLSPFANRGSPPSILWTLELQCPWWPFSTSNDPWLGFWRWEGKGTWVLDLHSCPVVVIGHHCTLFMINHQSSYKCRLKHRCNIYENKNTLYIFQT